MVKIEFIAKNKIIQDGIFKTQFDKNTEFTEIIELCNTLYGINNTY
jgi:hypothetical protein